MTFTDLETHENIGGLNEVIQAINSSLRLDEVLRIVMDTIIRLTRAERGFLMLRDENNQLVTHIARNWEQESLDPSEFAISRTIINRVVSDGKPILTTNAQEDPRFDNQDSVIIFNLRSILCVPLKVKGEITGVIYTDNRIRAGIFSEADKDLLTTFANHAAVALDNARLFDSLRQTLSEVTDLKNLMDNVLTSIVSGVITTDMDNKVLLCNRAAQKILASSEFDVTNKQLDEILKSVVGNSTFLNIYHEIERVRLSDREIIGKEFDFDMPNRGPVSLSMNFTPLKDSHNQTHGVAIVVDDLTVKKRLEAERRLFEKMVSPAVIKQLDPDKLQLGGERVEITTLFADIRGYTRFSEDIPPEELVTVLNHYLATAAEAVLAQQGTIDKFLGDAIMAWFNAPIPQPDHTLKAVRAALTIRAGVQKLQYKLPPELRLSFGAGIDFGEAVLGLVGTEKRMDYTAIGDSVNTAKRIQENAEANQILISSAAYPFVKQYVDVRPVAPIHAKGKRMPIQVFEIIGLKPI